MIMIRSILTITCVLVLVAVGYPASNELPDKPDTVLKGKFIQSYSKLPVFFESSQNKRTGEANFISRGDGYLLSLSPGEARFLLIRNDVTVDKHSRSKATFLRMQFIDGNPSTEVKGYKLLPGKSNYLFGNDRKKWRTNIPHYAEVRYKGVYPGIDLVYHGSQDRLEYDFMVAPGADPKVIRIAFQGVDELAIAGMTNWG